MIFINKYKGKEYRKFIKNITGKQKRIQNEERLNNLKRMLAKGLITQEEYDHKISFKEEKLVVNNSKKFR